MLLLLLILQKLRHRKGKYTAQGHTGSKQQNWVQFLSPCFGLSPLPLHTPSPDYQAANSRCQKKRRGLGRGAEPEGEVLRAPSHAHTCQERHHHTYTGAHTCPCAKAPPTPQGMAVISRQMERKIWACRSHCPLSLLRASLACHRPVSKCPFQKDPGSKGRQGALQSKNLNQGSSPVGFRVQRRNPKKILGACWHQKEPSSKWN